MTASDGDRDDTRPIDGSRWGEWVRAGNERWEVVRRSFGVFRRNTTELIELLNIPATNVAVSLELMGDDRDTTDAFWDELDQRLHNQIAGAVSLVDHTRRFLKYYAADIPTLVAEYDRRNAIITEMNETAFLRDLRNYLLHYGVAPVIQTLELGTTGHSVKLSSARLLEWRKKNKKKWSARSNAYLSSFADSDGPVLGRDVAAYANAMSELFHWLFQQRQAVHNDPSVLDRFRIDPS
jgi:hypothetical protein